MDSDVAINLLGQLDPNSLINACSTNKMYYRICKENKDIIFKSILKKFKVDYKQPKCLLYLRKQGKKYIFDDQNLYRNSDQSFNFGKLFLKYKIWYNETGVLDVPRLGITSIPELPNIRELFCPNNELIDLPYFKRLEFLDCRYNNISVLPQMPELVELHVSDTKIREISGYPNLRIIQGENLPFIKKLQNLPRLNYFKARVSDKINFINVICQEKIILDIENGFRRSFDDIQPQFIRSHIRNLNIRNL
jgi:Leucine-rich repeat (LRR) protein